MAIKAFSKQAVYSEQNGKVFVVMIIICVIGGFVE